MTCSQAYRMCRALCLAQHAHLQRRGAKTRCHDRFSFSRMCVAAKSMVFYMSCAWSATGCVVFLSPNFLMKSPPVESATYVKKCQPRSSYPIVVTTHWPLASVDHYDFGESEHADIWQVICRQDDATVIGKCTPSARMRAWAIASTYAGEAAHQSTTDYYYETRTVAVVPCVDAACRFASLSCCPAKVRLWVVEFGDGVIFTMASHEEVVRDIRRSTHRMCMQ